VPSEQSIQPEVAYGSFNTLLIDGHYNTGMLGPKKNIGVIVDVHRLSTDGFETFNDMQRNAGMIKVFYKLSDRTTITGFRGVVGALPNGAPYITTDRGFGSALPSASANYHIFPNWSVYGDFGKGDEIPPTSLFDVAGGGPEVGTVGSPMMTTAYQGGTVAKLNRFTLGADVFRVKFQNNYIAYTVPSSNPAYNLNEYYLGSDSYTLGFEAEANAALGYGFHLYANGTVDKANYTGTGVPSGLNVAATPSYTQDLALTYQAHGLDLGVVEKRVGTYYDDNGTYHNQAYVAPYNNVNLFFNYTIRKHSFFDESKIGFSVNNLFNSENITDVIAFGNNPLPVGSSTYFASTPISPIDQPNLTAGRSFTVTFKLGIFPGRHM
jgi:iron complex outermembrane receptor protein